MREAGMGNMDVKQLIDRWVSDPVFRQAMRADAEATIRREGIQLGPAEYKALKRVDWRLSDGEIQNRMSKWLA